MTGPYREPAAGQGDRPAASSRFQEPHADRRAQRLDAAERSLLSAQASIKASGIDPDSVSIAFAIARDCLAEARECSARLREELALARRERIQAQHERINAAQYASTGPRLVISDLPGTDLCPNPRTVQTPTELMDSVRMYWIWAGKPSYRVMERRCDRRFAASTLHAALHSDKLPGLEMIEAIIAACNGTLEHRQAFAFAWRRLQMQLQDAEPSRLRPLYPLSEPA